MKLTSFPTRFELGSVRSRISPVLGSGTGAQQHAAHHISSGLLSAPSGFAPSDGLFMMGFVFDFMISSQQERGSLPLGRVPLGPGRRVPVNLDTPGHPHGCGVLLGCPAARHRLHAPAEGKKTLKWSHPTVKKVPKYSEISPLPEISAGFRVLLCANSSGPPLPRQGPGEQTPGNSLEVLDPIPCLGQPVLREELQQLPGGCLQSGF